MNHKGCSLTGTAFFGLKCPKNSALSMIDTHMPGNGQIVLLNQLNSL